MSFRVISSLLLGGDCLLPDICYFEWERERFIHFMIEKLSSATVLSETKYELGALPDSPDKRLKTCQSCKLMDWLKEINETTGAESRIHIISSSLGQYHTVFLFNLVCVVRKEERQTFRRQCYGVVCAGFIRNTYPSPRILLTVMKPKMSLTRWSSCQLI